MGAHLIVKLDIELDHSSPVPLYYQIARELERAVADGRLKRGDFIENEVVIAERWKVSRLTLRRSIQELVDRGLFVRLRGVGTQVVNDFVPKRPRLGSSFDELSDRGLDPQTTVLAHERLIADDLVAEQLGVASGSTVVYVERCRRVDGRRIALLRNWITIEAGGDITTEQLADGGLFDIYRSKGIWPHSAIRRVAARSAGPVDAALLGVELDAALLAVDSTMQDKSGRRIEVGQQLYDGSAYTMELSAVVS